MSKAFKTLLMGLVCSLLLSVFNNSAYALNETIASKNLSNTKSIELAEIISSKIGLGGIISKESLTIGNETIELYVEFENPTESLNNLFNEYEYVFKELKSKYNLDNLNGNNFINYYDKFLLSLDDETCTYKNDEEVYNIFTSFYDIYENTSKNKEIIEMASKINSSTELTTVTDEGDNLLYELAMIIPTYNTLFEQVNTENLEQYETTLQTRALTTTELNRAISYAQTYANNPNLYSYAYFSADCTNFASQILEAAGKSQVSTTSQSTGWWHRVENNEHVHSYSWIRADAFARYIGIWARYTSVKTLSLNLKAGDFIAEDQSSDGDFDHIGFVTWVSSIQGTYTDEDGTSRTYKDFIVAQHTSNYIRNVTSNNNDWEKFDTRGSKVAIIGRSYTG